MKKFNYKKAEEEIAKKEFGTSYNKLSKEDKEICDMFVHNLALIILDMEKIYKWKKKN